MRVVVDASRNTLRLLIPTGPKPIPGDAVAGSDTPTTSSHRAILDVGEAGRLLGLDIADDADEPWYLELEDASGDQLRSVPVTVTVTRDSSGQPLWVDLPRRGDGYELTFPIGNQCWVRPRRAMS